MAHRRVRPQPAHARASNWRLTRSSWRTWPQRKLRRKVPEGGWRLDHAAENTGRPTGTQRFRVVDAVAARQRGSDQRQQLVPRVGPPRRAAQGLGDGLYEFPQAQVLGEGGRQEQAGIGHQAVVIKDDADPVGIVAVAASIGCSLFPGSVFCFQNHYPRFRGAPSGFFKDCLPQVALSVDSGLSQRESSNCVTPKASSTQVVTREGSCGFQCSTTLLGSSSLST